MKLIVTHLAPDIDAITSVWLLKRFDAETYADAKVAFVRASETLSDDQRQTFGVSPEDVTTVDTGYGVFDHHQEGRGMQRTCAARLVYDHLVGLHPELAQDWALAQIVEFATADDHFEDYFWPDAAHERHLFSLRSILHGLEYSQLHDDDSQVVFGMRCLDGIYASLKERKNAMDSLGEGKEFQTIWGKSIALETSNQSLLRYAQLKGYRLVVQKDPKRGNVRIKAAPLPEIDLTELYKKIIEKDHTGTWFFHKGRHMVLNGSSKKPNDTPSPLTIDEVIKLATSCQ